MKEASLTMTVLGLLLAGCATSPPTATSIPPSAPPPNASLVAGAEGVEGTWQRPGGFMSLGAT